MPDTLTPPSSAFQQFVMLLQSTSLQTLLLHVNKVPAAVFTPVGTGFRFVLRWGLRA